MATITNTFATGFRYYNGEGYNHYFTINIRIEIPDGSQTGTCYWDANLTTQTNLSSAKWAGYSPRTYQVLESNLNDNYIELNSSKVWEARNVDRRGAFGMVYTIERYSSTNYNETREPNQSQWYGGDNYSFGNHYMLTLTKTFASGSFSVSVDDDGNGSVRCRASFWLAGNHITLDNTFNYSVEVGRKIYKWTPRDGWQQIAFIRSRNNNWKKLKLYKKVGSGNWNKV